MIAFEVNDMTCRHCAGTIDKAVKAVDSGARVEIDLDRHLVHIRSSGTDAGAMAKAIESAGYTPTVVNGMQPGAERPARSGCCCG